MVTNSEDIVMKLLHYFITEKNYNPVVLYGAKDEIWLENMDNEYKIIRIVSNYIHNNEQLDFDLFRTKQIMKSIKKKTLSFKTPTLSLFVNIGENVKMEDNYDYITCLNVKDIKDVTTNKSVLNIFPDINKTLNYKEEGMDLFIKLTKEINEKQEKDAIKSEDLFSKKTPYITYILIAINITVFLIDTICNNKLTLYGLNNRDLVIRYQQYYRLITACFLHAGIMHLLVNCYSLYIIGSQIENFFGYKKYIIIYLMSGLCGNLLSIVCSNTYSIGASGAIFGLLGAILYFGYHYRLYLGNSLRTNIIPIICLNLLIGFLSSGIDNAAHIGGLIGGVLITMAVGVKYKSSEKDRTNGIMLSIIFIGFMIYLLSTL